MGRRTVRNFGHAHRTIRVAHGCLHCTTAWLEQEEVGASQFYDEKPEELELDEDMKEDVRESST